MTAVAVYTKPACRQCIATERRLTKKGITFTQVDVSKDPVAHAYVTGLGYLEAPVVVLSTGAHWSGYRPEFIDAIKETA